MRSNKSGLLVTNGELQSRATLYCKHKPEKDQDVWMSVAAWKQSSQEQANMCCNPVSELPLLSYYNKFFAMKKKCFDNAGDLVMSLSPLSCTESCSLVTNRPTFPQQTARNVSLAVINAAWRLVWPAGKTTHSRSVWFHGNKSHIPAEGHCFGRRSVSVYAAYDTIVRATFLSPDHPDCSYVTRIWGVGSFFFTAAWRSG